MAKVNLQGYKVDKIEFVNKLQNGTKISLRHKYSYNVQYAKDKNIARGEFDLELYDVDTTDKFGIHVVVVGFFSYNQGDKKEMIHAETFKALFPYAKALITTVTANCGIPPVIIPAMDIDDQQIYRFDNSDNTDD